MKHNGPSKRHASKISMNSPMCGKHRFAPPTIFCPTATFRSFAPELVEHRYLDAVMLMCCKDPVKQAHCRFCRGGGRQGRNAVYSPRLPGHGVGKCLLMFAINELNAD
jgi:hypothetical protein